MNIGTLLTTLRSCKRFPLPGTPKMSWENTITYGATCPFVVRQGGDHVAQRAEAMKQHDGGDTGGFYPGSGRREA